MLTTTIFNFKKQNCYNFTMKRIIITVFRCFLFSNANAQVGIGNEAPSAQLEISNDVATLDFPLLELNPQRTPAGTTSWQLAVIGDQLYMYDETRVQWLIVETTALQYGYGTVPVAFEGGNQILFFGGDNEEVGGSMPFNGTIVYMTITYSGVIL